MSEGFGDALKEWRKRRRFSQLQLAGEVGVSSRHLSFLETGRSTPSHEMVLALGEFLQIPRREINRMLVISGYAPVFRDIPLSDEGHSHVNYALDKLLDGHLPFPALVLNREWDVVKLNQSANSLMKEIGFVETVNLIECFLADAPTNSKILNWGDTASTLLKRLRYEIDMLGGSARLEKLEKELRSHLVDYNIPIVVDYSQSTMNTSFLVGGFTLSYFSLVSQMGAILDVTASEYKVELMFPVDDITKQYHFDRR